MIDFNSPSNLFFNTVVQQQLDKLSGKKKKRIEDEVLQEIENALSGKASTPSMLLLSEKTTYLRLGLENED